MNVLRRYNQDPAALMDIIEKISSKRNDLNYNMDNDTFEKLPSNEVVIRIKDGVVELLRDERKIGKAGKYNYFDFVFSNPRF